jgi:hypothetical protein
MAQPSRARVVGHLVRLFLFVVAAVTFMRAFQVEVATRGFGARAALSLVAAIVGVALSARAVRDLRRALSSR